MKKQTKKQILEFLHFWPMTIVVPILLLLILFPGIANAKVKSNDINFPGNFYTTEIKACKAMGDVSFNTAWNVEHVQGLIGYDWHKDHEENSNSLTVEHKRITGPIKTFLIATHNAIGNGNQKNIDIATDLAVQLAKADTLYDSLGLIGARKAPLCYGGKADPYAPCKYHEYQFARDVFGNYMVAAVWLKPYFTPEEKKIVDKYMKKMYKKFLKPALGKEKEQGFYQMANGGINFLVYASWSDNKKLAAKEMNIRFKEIDDLFFEDGYINNNSFRGVRGQWYHTYGLNSALAYIHIAKLWGAEVPESVMNKVIKASEVANLAIVDREAFLSRELPKKYYNKNHSTDPKHARWHTHQDAIGIGVLMELVAGVELEHDPVYLKKRRQHGIDDTITFNPNCLVK